MDNKLLSISFEKVFDKWAWKIDKNELFNSNNNIFEYEIDNIKIKKGYNNSLFVFLETELVWEEITDKYLLSTLEKQKIEKFVNSVNSKPHPSRWRAGVSKNYYVINLLMGGVYSITDTYSICDSLNYDLGNYFKTEKEAQEKLNKIKQILLEVKDEIYTD